MIPHSITDFFSKNQHIEYHYPKNKTYTKDWIVNNSRIPYLLLDIPDVRFNAMLQEAKNLDSLFIPHRDSESHRGWSSLTIHGISSKHTDHYRTYDEYKHLNDNDVPYTWTEIKDQCKQTVHFLQHKFPYDVYHRVRFMKLSPGGYITPHSDHNEIKLCAVNISLNNPAGCDFVFENHGIIPFQNSGSIFFIANGYRHAVLNNSDTPRYHIIIHGYPTSKAPQFDQYILDSYKRHQND